MDNMCIPNNSLLTKDSEYSAKDIHVLEGLETRGREASTIWYTKW
jgi:hypothetical protein